MKISRAVLGLVLLAGCFPKTAPPPAALSPNSIAWGTSNHVSTEDLEQGQKLFVGNCNKCHGYPDLMKMTDAHVPHMVERMGRKAHLAQPERDQVLHFVMAVRAQ